MTSSTLYDKKHFFIPISTKNKSCSKSCKTIFGRTNLCFAYIFGELGVTIAFWRLSWFQANFHDIKHPFHNKRHFFIPKSTKNKSCLKSCKTIFDRTNFLFLNHELEIEAQNKKKGKLPIHQKYTRNTKLVLPNIV